MSRVLLTDGLQRKTLAAARSLGKKGVEVLVAGETRVATTFFSRYCHRSFVCPDPHKDQEAYFAWLCGVLRKHPCEVLFPMDDATMDAAVRHKAELEEYCRVPVPGPEGYATACDKYQAAAAARAEGLACPRTVWPEGREDLHRAASNLTFPVVVKPRRSSGARGIVTVRRPEALGEAYDRVHVNYPFPMLQEYIPPGDKFDVCLLFDRSSRLQASFVQREVRGFPLEMGPSTVQESVWCPGLVESAARLMRGLNWYGVAEVEFLVDRRDGKAKFMEINPRFWNSLQAAVQAGVDFPWLLYKLAVGEEVESADSYPAGVVCRWLLPGDILHFLADKDRWSMEPGFFSSRKSGVHDDILSLEDPLPGLCFPLTGLRYVLDRRMWRLMFHRDG